MREFRPKLQKNGISKWQYEELRAFCRQYPEKKAQANALLGIQGCERIHTAKDEQGHEVGVTMPRSLRISTPTADAAIRRVILLEDCDLIDRVAAAAGDGQWVEALRLNCCYGLGYDQITALQVLPTSNRNAFFRVRREFFFLLMAAREESRKNVSIIHDFDTPGAVKT